MRANILLLAGVLIGIVFAASGLLEKQSTLALERDSVAKVNDISIAQSQFQVLANGIAEKKETPLEQAEYEFILENLIDEELLVQRGQELGFLQLNNVLRSNMTQALTTSILSENASVNVDDSTLEIFYQDNIDIFRSSEKAKFQHMKFVSLDKAELALKALKNGGNFEKVKEELAEKEIMVIPQTWLSMANIGQYFGPSLAEHILLLPVQSISPVIRSTHGKKTVWYLFYINEKQFGDAPDFENAKEVVSSEYRRALNEKTLHDYILWLRKRADIQTVDVKQLPNLIKTAR